VSVSLTDGMIAADGLLWRISGGKITAMQSVRQTRSTRPSMRGSTSISSEILRQSPASFRRHRYAGFST
jgi:hypothetical protein